MTSTCTASGGSICNAPGGTITPCCENTISFLTPNGYQCWSNQTSCENSNLQAGSGPQICIPGYPSNCQLTDCTTQGQNICDASPPGAPCCQGMTPFLYVPYGTTTGIYSCFQSQNECFSEGSLCEIVGLPTCGTN